jgi:hypothetical protein
MNTGNTRNRRYRLLLPLYFLAIPCAVAASKVDFNRDIRPLLSENCYACHGPDARKVKGGFRLDIRSSVTKPANSGKVPIVPGSPGESDLVRRIFTTDEDDLMPPRASHKILTVAQKQLLKRWISEGAEYQIHWAYSPPLKPAVHSNQHPIDYLVGSRLKEAGIKPSRQAEPHVLVRRLYFDLVGLPPKPEEVIAFEQDSSPRSYEQLVERLMASSHYGERMAIDWLDVVRFADTIGYHSDNPRNVWPYRDYVIRSFNQNKPFDQFTREQLAGDLLPGFSQEQKVASGFNRLLLTTEEGGAQPKDYEARQVADRVRALGVVWLGQTIGCAQCHDHKFDPFTMRDFYSLGAFFADVKEAAIGRREEGMLLTTHEQALEVSRLEQCYSSLQREFDAPNPELEKSFSTWLLRQETAPSNESIGKILKVPPQERQTKQKDQLFEYFKEQAPELADLRKRLADANKARMEFEAKLPRTLVTETNQMPRTVRILPRGDWMNDTGDVVVPALPAFLRVSLERTADKSKKSNAGEPDSSETSRRLNRLDLANWLVSRDNPLTARVEMNRVWKHFFGMGLSKVLDDFGSQGEVPPNQPLLDWLACEFMENGWDLKHMVRLIVTSATYRQSSTTSSQLLKADPDNRLLSRQGRWRLEAELVRDNALWLAALLNLEVGGPSVKPYQPEGYWENLNFPKRTYEASTGTAQYRRGLYTWWQRTFLHPSMLAFDGPTREECTAERNRSNVPQQALVLLHDPSYVEAARAFATRILRECKGDKNARLSWAWRQTLSRVPTEAELEVLGTLFDKHYSEYQQDRSAAEAFLKVGAFPAPSDIDAAELAAWTNVTRVLLNLHETITRS